MKNDITSFIDTRSFTYTSFAIILFTVFSIGFYFLIDKEAERVRQEQKNRAN
jgi:hypothetical protein